jgi:hypothetical protein
MFRVDLHPSPSNAPLTESMVAGKDMLITAAPAGRIELRQIMDVSFQVLEPAALEAANQWLESHREIWEANYAPRCTARNCEAEVVAYVIGGSCYWVLFSAEVERRVL